MLWQPNARTVYVLGAGVNQCLFDYFGACPPLSKTVFRTGLRKQPFAHKFDEFDPLFQYIYRNHGPRRDRLKDTSFDYELVLKWIDRDLAKGPSESRQEELRQLRSMLAGFLAFTIGDFSAHGWSLSTIRELASIIWKEEATVVTFNYDTIIEDNIQSVCGLIFPNPNRGPDESLELKWLAREHYGVPFDDLLLTHHMTSDQTTSTAGSGPLILKAHGSLNWFTYSNQPVGKPWGPPSVEDMSTRPGTSLLVDGNLWSSPGSWPNYRGLYLNPIIIAGSDKEKLRARDSWPFKEVWRRIGEVLDSCERLIVVGYRFGDKSSRSFFAKHLRRGAVEGRGKARELYWVSPSRWEMRQFRSKFLPEVRAYHFATVDRYVGRHPLATRSSAWPFG